MRTRVDDTIDNWYYEHYPVDWSDASRSYASNRISYNTEHNISQVTVEDALGLSTTPKVDVEPYKSWLPADGKEDDRSAHIGDTFTNTKFSGQSDVRDGRTWKFCATTNPDGSYTNYRWEPMSDSASSTMRAITDLENRVSNKRQVFINTPTTPYEAGDLWVITESIDGNTSGKNIYVCITPKGTGAAFSGADWISTNNFVGEDVLEATVDSAKSELVDTIREKVAEVDLREVLERGGFIEVDNGTYVPASGLLSKHTDANNVTTVTMSVGGEEITWQTTPGVDAEGNAYLVVDKPWGNPSSSSFVVSQDGLLEAHNALIYGEIHAGAGNIGGIEIHNNSIKSSNNNFEVTEQGILTAKNVNIEGTIRASSLEIGSSVNIPQGNISGLGDELNNIQRIANSAASTANSAASTAANAVDTASAAISTASDAVSIATTATNTAASASETAKDASETANSAKSGLSILQSNLDNLQNQVSEYLKNGSSGGSSGNTTPDWITNAFSQTLSNGGLLLSGNIFVANSDGYINAGMMGASGIEAAKTPRFFAGERGLPKNSELSSGVILNQNYPFIVTADGHLYAKNADLTGTLIVTRTIDGKEQPFDIADYVIGKMTNGKLDTNESVSGIIESLSNEVFGPLKEEKNGSVESDEAYRTRILNSNYLIGRVLRAEGKILALQKDIKTLQKHIEALQTDVNGLKGSGGNDNVIIGEEPVKLIDAVMFSCSTCGGTFLYKKNEVYVRGINGKPDIKYGDTDSIICPTLKCGGIAYKGLVSGDSTDIAGKLPDDPDSGKKVPILPIIKNEEIMIRPFL